MNRKSINRRHALAKLAAMLIVTTIVSRETIGYKRSSSDKHGQTPDNMNRTYKIEQDGCAVEAGNVGVDTVL